MINATSPFSIRMKLKKRSILDRVNFFTLFNYVAICLFLARAIFGAVEFLYLGMFFGLTVFLSQLLNQEKLSPLLIAFLIIVIMSYLITFTNNGLSVGALFVPLTLAHIGVAWRISTHGLSYQFSRIIFIGSLAYFFYSVLIVNLDPGQVFSNSRNYISVYFLNTLSIFYISIYLSTDVDFKKFRVITPAAVVFLASVLSVGTSGIISTFILLSLISMVFLKRTHVLMLAFLLLVAISYIASWDVFLSILATFEFLTSDPELLQKMDYVELTEGNTRYYIWKEYISSMDVMRTLAGINLSESFYGFNNYHNSFILLHARLGLFSFIIALMFLFSLIRGFKVNLILALCLFALLLRSFSDTTILAGSAFDFVIFYLIFFFHRIKDISFSGPVTQS